MEVLRVVRTLLVMYGNGVRIGINLILEAVVHLITQTAIVSSGAVVVTTAATTTTPGVPPASTSARPTASTVSDFV